MQSQPVEVIQTVLRFVIGVPILFDSEILPAAIDQPGWMVEFYGQESILANEKDYWNAERYRNTSRRVCTAWDAYLRPFEHRLVHLADVFGTRNVPVESITKALYISSANLGYSRPRPSDKNNFLTALHELNTPAMVRVLFFPREYFTQEEVLILAQRAPQVCTLVSLHGVPGPLHVFPSLVHGSTVIRTYHSLGLLCNLPTTLQSLSISIDVGKIARTKSGEPDIAPGPLSSLEFLRIRIEDQEDVMPLRQILLSKLGSRVTALQLVLPPRIILKADDLLDLCPQVQMIYLNNFAYHRITRPGSHRRLHTLVISLLDTGLVYPVMHQGLLVWPGWTQIRRVVSNDRWRKLNRWPLNSLTAWASRWEESLVRIEDRDGITIQEWLSGSSQRSY